MSLVYLTGDTGEWEKLKKSVLEILSKNDGCSTDTIESNLKGKVVNSEVLDVVLAELSREQRIKLIG